MRYLSRYHLPLVCLLALALVVSACDSEDDAGSAYEGQVQSVTGNGVVGATVTLEGADVYEGTTDEEGRFSIEAPEGSYTAVVSRPGYNPTTMSVSVGGAAKADSGAVFQLVGDANIVGSVTGSQDGQPLPGAEVSFAFDDNVEGDALEAPYDLTITTDANGSYSISGAPVGDFTSVVRAEGYVPAVNEDVSFEEGENEVAPTTPVEQPPANAVRVTLTWGENPDDLDSHMTGPDGSGGRFHIYYADQSFGESNLDVDDVTSYGPETITLFPDTDGMYRYSVFNYSNQSSDGALGINGQDENGGERARVQVVVTDADGEVTESRSYVAPAADPGNGNTWRVFEMTKSGSSVSFSGSTPGGLGYEDASGSSDTDIFLVQEDIDPTVAAKK